MGFRERKNKKEEKEGILEPVSPINRVRKMTTRLVSSMISLMEAER